MTEQEISIRQTYIMDQEHLSERNASHLPRQTAGAEITQERLKQQVFRELGGGGEITSLADRKVD